MFIRTKPNKNCPDCGVEIEHRSKKCRACSATGRRYTFTPEQIKTLSEAHKGIKPSPETIAKRVAKLIGRPSPMLGKKHSLATREKISLIARNPNRGEEGFRGRDWSWIRERVLERDEFTCQSCGLHKLKGLNVHHLHPYKETKENNTLDLITLCNSCHTKIEKNYICLMLRSLSYANVTS